MAEHMIGSLIYGDHPQPKKTRPWKQRLKYPVIFGLIVIIGGGLLYRFINYREESRVQSFIQAVSEGRYDDAYAMWDAGEGYPMTRFLEDWGEEGYYTVDSQLDVADSEGRGAHVIVYVSTGDSPYPVVLQVNKETLLLSFAP